MAPAFPATFGMVPVVPGAVLPARDIIERFRGMHFGA